jgi:hypothetical protein
MNYLTPIPAAASPDDESFIPGPVTPDPDEPEARQWTPPRMAAFLRHLTATHSVAESARRVGMSRQSAYKLRARLKGQPFDLAWECATRRQFDALAQAALDRALNGVEVPHFHNGELVHTSRRYDERLTVALLAMRDRLAPQPPRFIVEQGGVAADELDDLVDRVEYGDECWEPLRPADHAEDAEDAEDAEGDAWEDDDERADEAW